MSVYVWVLCVCVFVGVLVEYGIRFIIKYVVVLLRAEEDIELLQYPGARQQSRTSCCRTTLKAVGMLLVSILQKKKKYAKKFA